MRRQLLTVAVGIALSFLAVPASGYLVYQLSRIFPNEGSLGFVVRYILQPTIALLVGTCVGALAKAHPGLLAVFSLMPSEVAFFLLSWRRMEGRFLLFLSLGALNLLIAAITAGVVFAARTRRSGTHHGELRTNN
jgi:hypothetical protein